MTTSSARVLFLRLPLIVILLAGCAAGSTSSPSAGGPSASVAPSDAQGSEAAEPSAASCDAGSICAGPLAPGDYTSTGTGAMISFTLTEDGWSADPDTDGVGFALYYEDPGGPVGITVAPWAGMIFTDPCSPEPTETIGTAPSDLMGVITGFNGVTADMPSDTTVGGLPALVVELTTEGPCPDLGGKLWVFETSAGATFNLRDATQARIYAVDAGSFTVVVAIEALGDADYDALIEKADEILGTMVIASGG